MLFPTGFASSSFQRTTRGLFTTLWASRTLLRHPAPTPLHHRRTFAKLVYKRCYGCLDMIHKSHYTKRMWQNKKDIKGRRCDQCLKKEKLAFKKRKQELGADTPSWMIRHRDWEDYF